MARPLRNGRRPFLTQLVWLLDRVGEDIEFDLAVLGLDLVELWQQRRFRFLLSAIHRLPQHSNTKAALANDDEYARMVLDGRDIDDLRQSSGPSVTLVEFTPEVAALYDVIDRLGDVCAGLVGLGGKKPQRTKPVPRPKSAIERMAVENRRLAHKALAARVLGPRE